MSPLRGWRQRLAVLVYVVLVYVVLVCALVVVLAAAGTPSS
ncbi:hypothetical protein ACFWWM_25800 [Streptomyces sp. NPDC058682]|nr:hypothetical protein [Streptomyces sp. NBC_01214]MCX4804604.1 hypothetical protein [Streptomyces sp. NBC_01214]